MKNIAPFALLILSTLLTACNSRSSSHGKVNTVDTSETNNTVDNEDTDLEYVTLPSGAMVEAGIPEDIVDMMFKRIEAIENGDLASFRATLGDMDDGAGVYYQLNLIFTFFGDFFDIDSDAYNNAIQDGGEEFNKIRDTLFNSKPPLKSRNTGLIIKKLETVSGAGLKVTVKNNKNEEIVYYFLKPLLYP